MRYSEIVVVLEKILSVTDSGAGPPFPILYLIPKSWKVQCDVFNNIEHEWHLCCNRDTSSEVGTSVGPPGLWLAVKMKAPVAFDPYLPCVYKSIVRLFISH